MKQKWNITVSGACKTFTGPELLDTITGSRNDAWYKARKIEKETGRVTYIALAKKQ